MRSRYYSIDKGVSISQMLTVTQFTEIAGMEHHMLLYHLISNSPSDMTCIKSGLPLGSSYRVVLQKLVAPWKVWF